MIDSSLFSNGQNSLLTRNPDSFIFSAEIFKIVAETIDDMIIILDKRTRVVFSNLSFQKIFHYKKSELQGKKAKILFPTSNEFSLFLRLLRDEINKKNFGFTIPLAILKTKSGKSVTVKAKIQFIYEPGNYLKEILIIFNDLTKEKILEEQVIRSQRLSALGELAAGIAHDFNNVLSAILHRTEILHRKFNRTQLACELEEIINMTLDGSEIVKRLKNFTRTEASDQITAVDVETLVKSALDFTKVKWKNQAEKSGVKFSMDIIIEKSLHVAGNFPELKEALANIIFNSIDAMPDGGRLMIYGKTVGEHVMLSITDTGIGMTDEIKEKAFDPLFTTKGKKGTGFGLSIVYNIIKKQNGEIELFSSPGKGTTINLILKKAGLPLSKSEQNIEENEKKSRIKAKILVVEDDRLVRDALVEMLKLGGHSVKVAENGIKALEILRKESFHILFTDYGMPDVTGIDVAKYTKNSCPGTKIFLTTGWDSSDIPEEVHNDHIVDEVVQKPFRMDSILALISRYTDLNSESV